MLLSPNIKSEFCGLISPSLLYKVVTIYIVQSLHVVYFHGPENSPFHFYDVGLPTSPFSILVHNELLPVSHNPSKYLIFNLNSCEGISHIASLSLCIQALPVREHPALIVDQRFLFG